jgi:hypothetical protein
VIADARHLVKIRLTVRIPGLHVRARWYPHPHLDQSLLKY